uniref:Nucleoside-diphosphate-sugar epimerase n=1 Tax=Ganoderma boninense TaxID=34458 RepID=A0A5K1K4M0_9APHY|nr:Nucleoside-diphosphate-sugar epimerase [Ganoderma boninense]
MINDLWTILPFYSHRFEGLSQSAIVGDDIDAHSTALGSIRGTFNVSERLYVTTDGAIELRANLLDGRAPHNEYPVLDGIEPSANAAPTRLHMSTTNGPVSAQVGIYDTTSRTSEAAQTNHTTTRGRFDVKAQATDGFINLTFVDAPSDSDYALSVEAQVHVSPEGLPWWWCSPPDSSAPITVKMDETFEGWLKLETSKRVWPSVEWEKNGDGTPSGEDPSGQGRERRIEVQSGWGRAEGEVWWGGRNDLSGRTRRPRDKPHVALNLKAATSPIRLVL